MHRAAFRLTFSFCLAALACVSAGHAQTPRNRPLFAGEQWVQLFNGKDLTNWVEVGKEKWTVEDGVIHGQGVTNAYGYLRTEKKYKDFWLSIRFKCEADGNSGVYIHTEFKEGTVDVSQGKQFEIDRVLNHHTGGLYGEGRGWMAWPAPEYEQVIRPTDWNEMLMKVEGNHYVAILNGIEVLNFTDPVQKSFDGYIALQLHSGGLGNMRFKDILRSGYVGEGAGQVTLRPASRGFAVRGFAVRKISEPDRPAAALLEPSSGSRTREPANREPRPTVSSDPATPS